jgi:hypothetical protein
MLRELHHLSDGRISEFISHITNGSGKNEDEKCFHGGWNVGEP